MEGFAMTRQRVRKLTLIISLLLFPVTLYYFSPALIINAGLGGIVNGSFIVFAALLLLSIPFGRLFCAYLCPAGGLQECAFPVNERVPVQGWRNRIKYVVWVVWLAAVLFCYFQKGRILAVDFFFETEKGISISSVQSYLIYYGIVCLILAPAILSGKRAFCHYFCWMAPFMVAGMKLRRLLRLPGLCVRENEKAECVSCGKCRRACPMGIDVEREIKDGSVQSLECILCGACIDSCPAKALGYGVRPVKSRRNFDKGHGNGGGKKT